MRRILLALGIFAAVTVSKILGIPNFPEDKVVTRGERRRNIPRHDVSNVNIKLEEENLREMIEDFREFGVEYWRETKVPREDVLRALKEAYKNTASKLIMNFGRVFNPILHEWADIMKYVQVNPECN